VIAVLAPGQGSQTPGMLAPWLELPGASDLVGELGEAAKLDLLRLGTTADADEIKDTAVTQPLIVALGLVAAPHLGLDDANAGASVIAGHSVGELTGAAVAGALSPSAAVGFAARRGAEMAAACALTPTGMSALLGGDPDEVAAGIEAAGLTPANRNGAGQIVAAGAQTALAELAENPPGGTAVASGAELIKRLVAQVTLPVRWDLCLRTLRDLGVSAAIELPPAGALTGIAKRELPGVELLALKTPADLQKARVVIESARQPGQGEHTPDFQVVSAPAKGTFTRNEAVTEGQAVARGATLGIVRTNRDEHAVVAGRDGILVEWLRHDGDIVAAGLPVARLHSGSEH
jgi:[acyl-carrier-protein] S-malonyltransferase